MHLRTGSTYLRRLQEESRRAQKAAESLEKLKREGLLGRLFSGGDDNINDSSLKVSKGGSLRPLSPTVTRVGQSVT